MGSNPSITLKIAIRALRTIARSRGERIYQRYDSRLKNELDEGYGVVVHRSGAPVIDAVTRDGCDFSLAD